MNNLYRELAPISSPAWADLEEEAKRTFTRHVAGRRAVDVLGPEGLTLSAVGILIFSVGWLLQQGARPR